MSISISANNGMMNIPNQNFLFGRVSTETAHSKMEENSPAYSVSISREGLAKLNASKGDASMGIQKVEEYKGILSKAQIDVTGTIEADFHHRYTKLNGKDNRDDLSAEEFAKNALSTYADMFDEIKKGYADGTREIYIADSKTEFGYRRATEEDEIAALDAAFDFHASYTDAYVRFVNEDKDAMLSGMQRTQDMWDSQKSRAMAKQEEYEQEQRELRKAEEEKWNSNSSMMLGDTMKQARDFLKAQYSNFKDDIDGLLNAVFENMKISAN